MRRLARILLLALLAAVVLTPAVATAVEDAEEAVVTEGETEDGGEEVTFDGEPAVVVDLDPEPEEEVPAWTYRFLIPTLMGLTMVLVAALVIGYFTTVVKGRQQPVE